MLPASPSLQARGSVLVWLEGISDLSPLALPQVDFSHGGVEELLSHYANRSGALSQLPLPRSHRDDVHFTVPYLPLFFTGQNGIMSFTFFSGLLLN